MSSKSPFQTLSNSTQIIQNSTKISKSKKIPKTTQNTQNSTKSKTLHKNPKNPKYLKLKSSIRT
ncbi:hypothetical protein KFK09_011771 [Dendrobium nobile]|uniref:Uncharacterized protein n=1 Tax=Dendrobium nobile TaxID=94219 RepID=A0A8T3BFZ7_DENNO|nr:hypothetical protein KFK09_011771 [Dendrobium nobile]